MRNAGIRVLVCAAAVVSTPAQALAAGAAPATPFVGPSFLAVAVLSLPIQWAFIRGLFPAHPVAATFSALVTKLVSLPLVVLLYAVLLGGGVSARDALLAGAGDSWMLLKLDVAMLFVGFILMVVVERQVIQAFRVKPTGPVSRSLVWANAVVCLLFLLVFGGFAVAGVFPK